MKSTFQFMNNSNEFAMEYYKDDDLVSLSFVYIYVAHIKYIVLNFHASV